MKRTFEAEVLVLKGIVGLYRTFNYNFFNVTGQDIHLDYRDI